MRRQNIDDNASLELLLDTICNTFGGVLFISMLVVVLLNTTPVESNSLSPPDEQVEADLIEWEKRLVDTQREMKTLRSALAAQKEMARSIVDPNIRELLEEMRESQEQRTNFEEKRLSSIAEISRSQIEINRIARDLEELSRVMQEARANLESADEELQREIKLRTRAAKLPKMRRTEKEPVLLFLKSGRLTSYQVVQKDGSLVENSLEVEEAKDEIGSYLQPRKGAGAVVDLQGDNAESIDKKLDAYDAQKFFLAVVVWPDSFAAFPLVKDSMVRAEFEYRLIPFQEEAKAYLGQGAEEWFVQ